MTKVNILGVNVDNLSLQEVLAKISYFLQTKGKFFIVTPNPEFIIAAQKDKKFAEILNYADVATADGIGLIFAAKFFGQRLQRVTGVDLVWNIAELAAQQGTSIYLLGGKENIAALAAKRLGSTFPGLTIVGAYDGGEVSSDGIGQPEIVERINTAGPQILFVAFGQVKQEKWIFNNLDKLPSVKLAIGVGGAFDYIAGIVPTPPKIFKRLGLEWLYRLINQPRARWKRIINAVIIFPLLALKHKISILFKK